MVKGLKKGFTLIELLAVIIILAIIALFATPKILDIIEDSRNRANISTVHGIIEAAKLYYADSMFDDEKKLNIGNDRDIYNLIVVNGEKPEQGTLFVNNDGKVATSVIIGKKCYVKNYDTDLQVYDEDDENCDLTISVSGSNDSKNYKCIRATKLHTETCNSSGCKSVGYSSGGTITYGNYGTSGILAAGDAFDCDVNGDGEYNPETERFYYVSSLDTDNNYGVLIYYSSFSVDKPENTTKGHAAYYYQKVNNLGPIDLVSKLPSVKLWTNVSLLEPVRIIKNELGETTSNNGASNLSKYNFSNYAARLLTTQEVEAACGITTGSKTVGELDTCEFLLQNTNYSTVGGVLAYYWLETPVSANKTDVWAVNGYNRYLYNLYVPNTMGVRPVIEVLKDDIDYNSPIRKINNDINIEFSIDDGVMNEINWAKEDFYVKVKATDNSSVGISSITSCTTNSDICYPLVSNAIKGNESSRLIAKNGNNIVCSQAIDKNGDVSEIFCSDIYQLDKELSQVVLEYATVNNGATLTAYPFPKEPISGAVYEWYNGDNVLDETTVNNYRVNSFGKYKVKVTSGSGIVVYSNEVEINDFSTRSALCKRARTLHTEECIQGGCASSGYTVSGTKGTSTITYGNLGEDGKLTSGDAFDCDVNGDGIYNSLTERFYYVTDLEEDDDYAVLVHYANTNNGIFDNSTAVKYTTGDSVTSGPLNAVTYLPTKTQWNNTKLFSDTRAITTEKGVSNYKYSNVEYQLPLDFDYSNYAARLLTVEEINRACNTSKKYGDEVDLYNCNYLLQNTQYANYSKGISGYWLENVSGSSTNASWYTNSYGRIYASGTSQSYGVRPVIEVLKTDIEYGYKPEVSYQINDIICRRATELHTEICNSSYCSNKYSNSDIVTYGNLGTSGKLKTGDAFDCDVNGDGIFDPKDERFYYLNDLDSDKYSDYAVLTYYRDFTPKGAKYYAYYSKNDWNEKLASEMPKNDYWTNVSLSSPIRDTYDQYNSLVLEDFNYGNHSARLASLVEVVNACNVRRIHNTDDLAKCEFLLENSSYTKSSGSYYHKSLLENYYTAISPDSKAVGTYNYGYARPVIEVAKSNIDYGALVTVTFDIAGNKNVDKYVTKPYIKINVSNPNNSVSGYKWCKGVNCTPTNEETETGKIVSLNSSNEGQVCVVVKYKNGIISNKVCSAKLTIEDNDYNPKLCKRATTLHGSYGNLGSNGELISGDAFDCDVNGDGIYNSETERFYYVTDLDKDKDYAVLIYYNNTNNGIPDSTSNSHIKFASNGYSYYGPTEAMKNLPTTSQWKNVSLYNSTRKILNDLEGNGSMDGLLPDLFDYSGYAARLLTLSELKKACNNPELHLESQLEACSYLLENTQHSSNTNGSDVYGYYLESIYSNASNMIYLIQGSSAKLTTNSSSYNGIATRPVIEVDKANIDYGNNVRDYNFHMEFDFIVDDNVFNEINWAKEDFYVTIKAKEPLGYGVKQIYACTTTEEKCNPKNGGVSYGNVANRLIASTSVSNKVCVQGIDNYGLISDIYCSPSYKLDKTKPEVTVTNNIKNGINYLSAQYTPETSISGYTSGWYKDGTLLEEIQLKELITISPGSYTYKVITNAGIVGESTPIVIGETNLSPIPVCIRATKLHTEVCDRSWGACSDTHGEGATITYGNLGEDGILASGDAFNCDVNGDGIYNPEIERFYYVSDLYNTSSQSFDNNYGVLVYYNNTSEGLPDNSETNSYYDTTSRGPMSAIYHLPTTEQWSNVSLSNIIRPMLTEENTDFIQINPYTKEMLNSQFSYEGHAARLLTAQEVNEACKVTIKSGSTTSLLDCEYLLQNTTYFSVSTENEGYWLENPLSTKSDYAWYVSGNGFASYSNGSSKYYYGVRPVIEVEKSKISYGNGSSYQASIKGYDCSEGGTLSSDNKQCTLTTTATLDCADGYQLVGNMCYKIDNTKKTIDIVCSLASDGYEKCTNWNEANPGKHNHCVKKTDIAECPTGYVMDSNFDSRTHCVPAGIQNCGSSEECLESYRNQAVLKICPNGGDLFTGNEYPEDEIYIGECYTYSTETTVINKCLDGYTLNNNNCVNNTGTSASTCSKGTINSEGKCVYTYSSTPSYYCPQGGTLNGTICKNKE